jgi:hypothetical protein
LRFAAFFLLLAIFPRGVGLAAEPMLLLDDFDSSAGWGAVGRAQIETAADGYRDRCLRMQLGVRDSGPVQTAIVQGPNSAAADAWERGPTDGWNALPSPPPPSSTDARLASIAADSRRWSLI